MSVYRPKYRDPNTGELKQSQVWWYDFTFAGRRISESAKTTRKTIAKESEKKRRLELEQGFNGIQDKRADRIRSIKELATAYLKDYKVRHKSAIFAEYALGHVARLVGASLVVEVTDKTVTDYQTTQLREKAATKSINEEVGALRHAGCGDSRPAVGARRPCARNPDGWRQQDGSRRRPDHSAQLGPATGAGRPREVVHATVRHHPPGMVSLPVRDGAQTIPRGRW